jgi:hypothetical protein
VRVRVSQTVKFQSVFKGEVHSFTQHFSLCGEIATPDRPIAPDATDKPCGWCVLEEQTCRK